MTRVILASASPRRRELLAALVSMFEVIPSDAAERLTGNAVEDAERLALSKAELVACETPGVAVIGADTIVFDEVRSYGKPADAAEAIEMLRALRGRVHTVVTGVAVVRDAVRLVGSTTSQVTLAALPDSAIAEYVASGRPLDKAGAYAIQDDDVPTVTAIEGCYCSVVGLPLWRLRALLAEAGVATRPPSDTFPRCQGCPDREG